MVENRQVDGSELCGEIDYYKLTLEIGRNQPALHERATLMHEVLHGIANHTGHHDLRANENHIDALAYSLVRLLRDNPTLVDYLTRD